MFTYLDSVHNTLSLAQQFLTPQEYYCGVKNYTEIEIWSVVYIET